MGYAETKQLSRNLYSSHVKVYWQLIQRKKRKNIFCNRMSRHSLHTSTPYISQINGNEAFPGCLSVSQSVWPNFVKGREVSLVCFYMFYIESIRHILIYFNFASVIKSFTAWIMELNFNNVKNVNTYIVNINVIML